MSMVKKFCKIVFVINIHHFNYFETVKPCTHDHIYKGAVMKFLWQKFCDFSIIHHKHHESIWPRKFETICMVDTWLYYRAINFQEYKFHGLLRIQNLESKIIIYSQNHKTIYFYYFLFAHHQNTFIFLKQNFNNPWNFISSKISLPTVLCQHT